MAFSETEYEAMEGWESESEGAWEAARRGVKKPSSAPSFRPRPTATAPTFVTQTQLEAALVRVDGKIKTVSDGISTIKSRVGSLAASVKKEADERKKSTESQGKDLNQKLQMLALIPLLVKPPAVTLSAATPLQDAAGNPITQVTTPDSNGLDAILPLLLVSGMGTSSGGFGFGGGDGSDGGMMMMALVLLLANK